MKCISAAPLAYAHEISLMYLQCAGCTVHRLVIYAPAAWWICSALDPGAPDAQRLQPRFGPGFPRQEERKQLIFWGPVLAVGNISSLYLLEIPSWTAGYWWYRPTSKTRDFQKCWRYWKKPFFHLFLPQEKTKNIERQIFKKNENQNIFFSSSSTESGLCIV